MLDPKSNAKVSEKDYDYQIWLPLLKSKLGETVPENTTEANINLYHPHGNIIGFKTDLRGILDFDEEEFDIICGEGCLHDATSGKVGANMSKLVREGKEAHTAVQRVYDSAKEPLESNIWLCQLIGLQCKLSTLHATKHGCHVNVLECSITFPTSLLNPDNTITMENLFSFRDSVEQDALTLQRILEKNKQKLCAVRNNDSDIPESPERPTVSMEPTWYTSPRSERSQSRIPAHMVYESGVESDGDDGVYNDQQTNVDGYGFVKTESGWLDVTNNKEYAFHPYHI